MKKKSKDYDYSAYVGMGHNQDMSDIVRLAEEQLAAEIEVSRLESELERAKETLRQLAEKTLPEKMEEIGVSEYTTTTGISIQVKEKIRGSLPVENKDKGYKWLEDNGFGGLIETEVVVPFRRGELEKANALVKELQKDKKQISSLERNVHHARLDGFIREQLSLGKDIPLNIFGVYRQRIAKVET